MAFTFPVPVGSFAQQLRVARVAWSLREFYAESGTRGGRLLRKELAEPLWAAEITLTPMTLAEARGVRATIRRIGAMNHFHLYNPEAPFPRHDPAGSILGGSSVTVHSINGRAIRLTGLPAGYQLAAGDFLSGAGTPRSLHEASEPVTANGAGITPSFEVTPAPRPALTAGNAVDLRRPAARMMFASIDTGISEEQIASGITLQAIEAR